MAREELQENSGVKLTKRIEKQVEIALCNTVLSAISDLRM